MLAAGALGALPAARGVEAAGPLEVLAVGWDGAVVADTWSPVRLRVGGGTSDATGRVEVVLRTRRQAGPQAAYEVPIAAYAQELALPAGVVKEVTVWARVPANATGAARLVLGNRPAAEAPLDLRQTRAPGAPLVGALADAPAVSRALSQVSVPLQGLPRPIGVARLPAADVPAAAERLDALTALVVQGTAAAALTGEQQHAVYDWVRGGGHLVLAGGPDAPRAAVVLPPGALPLSFAGTDGATDLTPLAQWAGWPAAPGQGPARPLAGPAARFQAGAGAPLAGPAEHPLAWRLSLGQGTVTFLAADPALEPLAGWPGTPALLRAALAPALATAGGDEPRLAVSRTGRLVEPAARLQQAVEAMPPDVYPGWRTVALVLGGFALAAGPVAHVALRRAHRREWIWLVVPGAAVLVSAAMYLAGVGRGGRDVLAVVVGHVRIDAIDADEAGAPTVAGAPAPGPRADHALAAGFYAPTRARLVVTVPGDTPVRVAVDRGGDGFGPFGGGGATGPEPPVRVVAGRDTRVEFAAAEWDMRSLAVTRVLRGEAGTITAHLAVDGTLVRGTVRNDTPYPLEHAGVAAGDGVAQLGSLAPGQTAQVVLDPGSPGGNPAGWRFGGPRLAERLLGRPAGGAAVAAGQSAQPGAQRGVAVMAGGAPAGGPPQQVLLTSAAFDAYELPRDPEIQRRARLLDAALADAAPPGPLAAPGRPLTFYAFTRAPVGGGHPSAGRHPTYHLALIEQPLRLEAPPGPFTLPAALIPVQPLPSGSRPGFDAGGAWSWLEVQSGSAAYAFRPPLPARLRPEALVLTTRQVGPSAAVAQGRPAPLAPNAAPGPAEAGVFALYNWHTGAWDPLEGGLESVRVQPAAPYVGDGGQVRVRVTAAQDRLVRFVLPQLTVEGVVAE